MSPNPGQSDQPDPEKARAEMSASERQRLDKLLRERVSRMTDGLQIYRPLPAQLLVHTSPASELLVRGGNRSGKSISSFAETASAATGIPILGPDGRPLPFKYPTDRPLVIWVIGYDLKHIGQTIYRMLFTRNHTLRMIRDLETEQWRAWRPWEPEDKAREKEVKPAGPFIPKRFIDPKGWAWEDKAKRQFTQCTLRSRWPGYEQGTIIYAFSSKAEPKMGDPVDLIHIDEDIFNSDHYAEWQARISDRKGRIMWSAFPHSSNDALSDLSDRAEKQSDREVKDVEEVRLRFSENPFMDDNEKRKRREGWSDDERAARDDGEFLNHNSQMYPSFSVHVHGVEKPQIPDDKIVRYLTAENRWRVPEDWTRYVTVDPGHNITGVMFAAVPPPEVGDYVVWYDELYLRHHTASDTAAKIAGKVAGQYIHAFLMDGRAKRITNIGTGRTIGQQYSDAFRAIGLESGLTGSDFIPGSDDVTARASEVRNWLTIRSDGTTKLRIVSAVTKAAQEEFRKYKKRFVHDEAQEQPIPKNNHLMNTLEYLAMYSPKYVPRTKRKWLGSAAYQAFLEWMKPNPNSRDDGAIHLGPGSV